MEKGLGRGAGRDREAWDKRVRPQRLRLRFSWMHYILPGFLVNLGEPIPPSLISGPGNGLWGEAGELSPGEDAGAIGPPL